MLIIPDQFVMKRGMPKPRSEAQISYNMSRVRCKGSEIERLLSAALRRLKLRPAKQANVFGRPDFAFRRQRVAVFCDSHFWHGHNWSVRQHDLKKNREFWIGKIETNMKRDREVTRRLRRDGWIVLRFWEHQIKESVEQCAKRVQKAVLQRSQP